MLLEFGWNVFQTLDRCGEEGGRLNGAMEHEQRVEQIPNRWKALKETHRSAIEEKEGFHHHSLSLSVVRSAFISLSCSSSLFLHRIDGPLRSNFEGMFWSRREDVASASLRCEQENRWRRATRCRPAMTRAFVRSSSSVNESGGRGKDGILSKWISIGNALFCSHS